MSPRTRASIFIVIALAWWGLAAMSLAAGQWLLGTLDLIAGAATAAFAYRTTHPRRPRAGAGTGTGTPSSRPKDQVKELRAPRPPK